MKVLSNQEQENYNVISKLQYLELLSQTGTVFFTQDKQLRYISIIDPHSAFDEKEVIGKTDKELLPFNELETEILTDLKKSVIRDGKVRREDVQITIEGSPHYYDLIIQPLLDDQQLIVGVTCISIDITERKRGVLALAESEKKLKDAQKITHIGYYDMNLVNGELKWADETFNIFGIPIEHKEPSMEEFEKLIYEEDAAKIYSAFDKSITEALPFDLEYRIIRQDGTLRYIHSRAEVEQDSTGKVVRMFGTIQDITKRKETEFELKKQNSFIQKIADISPSIIYILDVAKNKSVFVNQATMGVLGYTVEEFKKEQEICLQEFSRAAEDYDLGKMVNVAENFIHPFIHPDDIGSLISTYSDIFNNEVDSIFEVEFRMRNKKGEWRWMNDKVVPFQRNEEGKVTQFLGLSIDITNQKRTDSDSKNAIMEEQEKERQRIAADLHDAINPLLSAAKLNAEALKEKYKGGSALDLVNLNNTIHLLEQSMKEIKDIASNLMPAVLKDFGLQQGLNDLCTKISESKFLVINLDVFGLETRLDEKMEVILFRITQELLNNIIKHADASSVEIQLIRRKQRLVLMVDDNGKGFDYKLENLFANGAGFRNIETRVSVLDGKMNIDSLVGRGTTITIEVPLHATN